MALLYFAHDWILDRIRIAQFDLILHDLITTGDSLGIRFFPLGGETAEGYYYSRFVIGVPSSEALETFVNVAMNWNFKDWRQLSDDDEATYVLKSPNYERVEALRKSASKQSNLTGPYRQGLMDMVIQNEFLRETLDRPDATEDSERGL